MPQDIQPYDTPDAPERIKAKRKVYLIPWEVTGVVEVVALSALDAESIAEHWTPEALIARDDYDYQTLPPEEMGPVQ
jgi:hypothetical protein